MELTTRLSGLKSSRRRSMTHMTTRRSSKHFIGILLLVPFCNHVEGFVPLNLSPGLGRTSEYSFGTTSRLRDAAAGEQSSIESSEDGDATKQKSGIFRAAIGETSTRLSNIASKGSSDMISVASAATSGIVGIAEKGSIDVRSLASAATSGIVDMANKGSSDVRSVASAASSGIAGIASKGSSDVQSVASAAASGLKGLATKGSSDALSVATNTGEFLRWMDTQAKDGAGAASSKFKSLVLGFTGKKEYQVGDVTKELLRRVATAEYNLSDLILLLKVLLAVGVSIAPVTMTLPVSMVLEMLNVSLEQRIGGKLVEALAASVDTRVAAAFTGDDKHQIGDFTKRALAEGILRFTGKITYEEGDIQRAVVAEEQKNQLPQGNNAQSMNSVASPKKLELPTDPDFEEFDRLFRERYPGFQLAMTESLESATTSETNEGGPTDSSMSPQVLDMKIANELEEWDRMFKEKYPD